MVIVTMLYLQTKYVHLEDERMPVRILVDFVCVGMSFGTALAGSRLYKAGEELVNIGNSNKVVT